MFVGYGHEDFLDEVGFELNLKRIRIWIGREWEADVRDLDLLE